MNRDVYYAFLDACDEFICPTGCMRMLINAPLSYSFCEENRDNISEEVVILKALQIIAKRYGYAFPFDGDDYLDRFQKVAFQHLSK